MPTSQVKPFDIPKALVWDAYVNGQQKILVGGQQFSLPADSSSPSGRTAELHAGGQQFSKWADGAVPEDSRWLGVGARSKIA